jgi:hypothetical protein
VSVSFHIIDLQHREEEVKAVLSMTEINRVKEEECSIPMCGGEGETTMFCTNGHRMHRDCIVALIRTTYPNHPPCPLCRDQSICAVSMSVMPDLLYMTLTPFSQTAAVVAMMIGEREYTMLCMQQRDQRQQVKFNNSLDTSSKNVK